MSPVAAWELLGIAPTNDERAIKKAYAAKVRVFRPDTHPQEFSQLRLAYELAMRLRHAVVADEAGQVGVLASYQDASQEVQAQAASQPQLIDALLHADSEATSTTEMASERIDPALHPETAQHVQHAPQPSQPSSAQQDAPAPPPEPLSEARAMLDALALYYREHGEKDAVQLMHAQIDGLAQASIDTRLDYEGLLLSSLLNQDQPVLLLTFEAARRFAWEAHMHDVAHMVGEQGAHRLAIFMDFSKRAIFARHFSSNRWVSRVHWGRSSLPHWGNLPQVQAGQDAAFGWFAWCDDAGLPDVKYAINLHVVERMDKLILTADIWFALCVGWLLGVFAADAADGTTAFPQGFFSLLVAVVLLPMPLLWRRMRAQTWMPARFHRRVWGSPEANPAAQRKVGTLFMALFILAFASPVLIITDMPPALRTFGYSILAFVGALAVFALLGLVWKGIRWVEDTLTVPFLKLRHALDVHVFEQTLSSKHPDWPQNTVMQRIKSIPKVWVAERKKNKLLKAQQAQQQKPSSVWSWLWFPLLMVLMAFLRAAISK